MREAAEFARETAAVRRLDDVAAIRVWGPEARSWLNGQVTNQVALLAAGGAVYALAVSIKGRILSEIWALARDPDDLVLLVPAARREALLAHFDKYIVMEDVDVEASDDLVVITVQGPKAAEVVGDRASFPCSRLHAEGRDLLVTPDEADAVLAALLDAAGALGGGAIDEGSWQLARVRAGIPAYPADFDDGVYPQEAGLNERAVSYDKGCYLGQEVVCMLEQRGQLRRHLVKLESSTEPTVGGDVLVADRKVGSVRSAVHDPDSEKWLAMAYVKRKHAAPGTELDAGGAAATIAARVGK